MATDDERLDAVLRGRIRAESEHISQRAQVCAHGYMPQACLMCENERQRGELHRAARLRAVMHIIADASYDTATVAELIDTARAAIRRDQS